MKLSKTREELIKMYIEALEQNDIPWRCRWINENNKNGISGLEYSGINKLILNYVSYKEKYSDNRWYTYKQIKDLRLKLKDAVGKGVPVEFWSAYNYKLKEKFNLADYEKYILQHPDSKNDFRIISRTAIVFNGSLVDGLPKQNKSSNKIRPLKQIDNILKSLEVEYEECVNRAYYIPLEDKIMLPTREKFIDEYSYYATQIHEICHATGHKSRLNREVNIKDKIEYAREELIAEISSSFLMQELKIPAFAEHYDNHKSYINSWLQLFKEKPQELFKAISESNKVENFINEKCKNRNKERDR